MEAWHIFVGHGILTLKNLYTGEQYYNPLCEIIEHYNPLTIIDISPVSKDMFLLYIYQF